MTTKRKRIFLCALIGAILNIAVVAVNGGYTGLNFDWLGVVLFTLGSSVPGAIVGSLVGWIIGKHKKPGATIGSLTRDRSNDA